MHIEEPMQRALGKFDWKTVELRLNEIDETELRDWVKNLIDVILRDGYLILRRPDTKKQAQRDAFLERLRTFLQNHGMQDLLEDRDGVVTGQFHTETAYHEVLRTLNDKLMTRLSAAELAWSALRVPERTFRDMQSRMFATPLDPDVIFDPVTVKVPVDKDGVLAHPDDVLNALHGTLTNTLKMLGHGNSWFRDDGILILPSPVPETEEHSQIASANLYLAAVWRRLELSEGRCRYFGGNVTREMIQVQGSDGTHQPAEAIKFDHGNNKEIEVHIADERLRRMIFNFEVDMRRDPRVDNRVATTQPVPTAPEGYVSLEEVHGALVLSRMLFKSIFDVKRDFAGLTLPQWLRGYAVIRKLATEHLNGSPSPDGLVLVEEGYLVGVLTSHGLSEPEARVFLGKTCFGKESDDVFDAPFVRCEDGRLCFVVAGAANLNLAFAVLSQLATLHCNMSWKGKPLEEEVIALFKSHEVDSVGIHRKIDGEELEIDCVALWGDFLFVLEDKNYSLPGDNAQQNYWFLHDQADAAGQVLRKVQAIEAHPEIVSEAFCKSVTWKRIVPVVLNGTPFSLPGNLQGVHFYDYSALCRFFEEGYLALSTEQGGGEGPRDIPAGVTRLWSGDSPRPEDLIRQLEQPAQVVQAAHFWTRRVQAITLSDRLRAVTFIVDRVQTTTALMAEALGIDEANLKASRDEGTDHEAEKET
jgi:hypothetical protein